MHLTEGFKTSISRAIEKGTRINFQTHVLGDSGEDRLKYIIESILNHYNRIDLMDLMYTAAKELIVNSTKAAIKRILFEEKGILDSEEEIQESVMTEFKESLTDKKFPYFRKVMKDKDLRVNIIFSFNSNRILMKVINNFEILPKEEKRIREKFVNAKKYDNLFEFYMDHGDNTEGAGMGITLVEILLMQSGFDRHLFTIYSYNGTGTVARVELPLSENYKSRRALFQDLLQKEQKDIEILRKEFGKE
jgi:hypothetical protein